MDSSISREDLINSILVLVYNNVNCKDPKDSKKAHKAAIGFENRILGFRAEIEFVRKISDNEELEVFAGPTFLPNEYGANPTNSPVIFTVDTKPAEDYLELYEKYSALSSNLFYLEYTHFDESGSYEMVNFFKNDFLIPVPKFKCYQFNQNKGFQEVTTENMQGIAKLASLYSNRGGKRYLGSYAVSKSSRKFMKSILGDFSHRELNRILSERAVFDGFLGFNVYRGKPSDIDCIINTGSGYKAFEVKEKDLTKNKPIGFGMDSTRIIDILYFQDLLNMKYYYVVKHVGDQDDRNHISWKRISMHDLVKYGVESRYSGGTGMKTTSEWFQHTLVARKSKYSSF